MVWQDVDFAQLQLLHVGGRKGLRIPRLADFLGCETILTPATAFVAANLQVQQVYWV